MPAAIYPWDLMARPKRDPDPRARGFLRAWVSGAMLWSSTTKRLLKANEPGEAMLAMVSLYLCLNEACLLVEGRRRVPYDDVARSDCPIDPSELERLRDRAEGFRDEVLHLSDKTQEGRAVHTAWTADPPFFVFKSCVGDRGKLELDSISRPEVEELLRKLDPWLHRHWERLVHEDDDIESAASLRAKMEGVMGALSVAETDNETTPEES